MQIKRLTEPSALPVTLETMKTQLRIDHNAEDGLITALMISARETIERETHLALLPANYRVSFEACDLWSGMTFGLAPITMLVAQGSVLVSGAFQALGAEALTLDPSDVWPRLYFEAGLLPREAQRLQIEVVAGYADPASIPASLSLAIQSLAAHWYDKRDCDSGASDLGLPGAIEALIAPFRWRHLR